MNTTITTTERLAALIDEDAPAKVRRGPIVSLIVPDDLVLRVPDFRENGFAVFIGEEATVLVEEHVLRNVDLLLPVGGVKARTGHFPSEDGIVVMPHTGTLENVTYTGKTGEAYMAWSLVRETLVSA